MALGLSYQPGADQQNGNGGQGGPQAPPVQEAIRLLSLRLPSVQGARSISPQALLQGQGSAGLGAGQGMSLGAAIEFLRRLLQQSGGRPGPQAAGMFAGQSGGGGGFAPTPRVIPGALGRPSDFDVQRDPNAPSFQPVDVTPPSDLGVSGGMGGTIYDGPMAGGQRQNGPFSDYLTQG